PGGEGEDVAGRPGEADAVDDRLTRAPEHLVDGRVDMTVGPGPPAGPKGWKPDKGIAYNRKTIEKVYAYYGDLYQQHPDLQWLGLAAIAGPFFYAGWQDLDAVRKVADPGKRARMISKLLGLPRLPEGVYEVGGSVIDPLGTLLSAVSAKELDWFLDLFFDMQRQTFMDLGW
ncbi:MAG: hypothetical protein ACRDV9_06835, partial [Acidimicrobiia bacterium]